MALSQTELDMLSKLPAELRPQVELTLIKAKTDAATRVKEARETFSVSLSETVRDQDGKMKPGKGGFKVTGLGSRFPVTLYPEQWEVIFNNIEAIRACYNDPTNRAKSDQLRK